jgi:hypothetical protein
LASTVISGEVTSSAKVATSESGVDLSSGTARQTAASTKDGRVGVVAASLAGTSVGEETGVASNADSVGDVSLVTASARDAALRTRVRSVSSVGAGLASSIISREGTRSAKVATSEGGVHLRTRSARNTLARPIVGGVGVVGASLASSVEGERTSGTEVAAGEVGVAVCSARAVVARRGTGVRGVRSVGAELARSLVR